MFGFKTPEFSTQTARKRCVARKRWKPKPHGLLLWQGTDIRQIQQLLGHNDVKTMEIYTHVRNPHEAKVVCPLDRLVRDEVAAVGCTRAD